MKKSLIFVYNADSSLISAARDYFVKTVTPSKYKCRLCGLTYNAVGMKGNWKKFVESLPYKSTFLHSDEFLEKFPNVKENKFPAVFVEEGGATRVLIPSSEINKIESLADLEKLVAEKIKGLQRKGFGKKLI